MSWLSIVNKADKEVEIVIDGVIGGSFFFDEGVTMEMVNRDLKELKAVEADVIHVKILNSPGGSTLHGMGIVDLLMEMTAKKTVEIVGMAASMAAGIAMVAKKEDRTMSPNSWFLVHRVTGDARGTIKEIKSQIVFFEKNEKQVIDLMLAGADITSDELDELMDLNGGKGEFLTAEEAVEKGFIGEVKEPSGAVKIAAYAKDFDHLPTLPMALKESPISKPMIDVDALVAKVISAVKGLSKKNPDKVTTEAEIKTAIEAEVKTIKEDFEGKIEAFETYKSAEQEFKSEIARLKGELKGKSQSTGQPPKKDPNIGDGPKNDIGGSVMKRLTSVQKKKLNKNAEAIAKADAKKD